MSDATTDEGAESSGRAGEADPGRDPATDSGPSSRGLDDRVAFVVSAVFGLALATGSVWFVGRQGVWHEALLRVRPTTAGGGVGADWVHGVGVGTLTLLIDVVHFADVVLGIFILLMVFVHWAAFHRLGDRMRPPAGSDGPAGEEAVADGGTRDANAASDDGSADPPADGNGGDSR